jgi:hypothetical protein
MRTQKYERISAAVATAAAAPNKWGLGATRLSNLAVGSLLTCLSGYMPLRLLLLLSERPSPRYWDLSYHGSVALRVAAVVAADLWLAVATGIPTVLLNGVTCLGAWFIERRRQVRVYITARGFLFAKPTDAL